MRAAIKWIAIGIGTIVVLVGLVVAFVVATFDPNDYKDRIVETVQQRTGRTLVLQGDLALSFFPSIGIRLGLATLSEPKSTREFAAVESAVVSVKLLPLLSKEVIVDAIELDGLRLNLVRDASGRLNFEDLAGAGSTPAAETPAQTSGTPVQIDIARIEISNAEVSFVDQAAGTRYQLSDLDLETGRVARGIATPVELSARLASEKPKAQIDARLEAVLTLDLEAQRYKLDKIDLSAAGDYGDLTALKASVAGHIEARTESGEYLAQGLTTSVAGKRTDGPFDLKLDAPRLVLTRDKVDGGNLTLAATSGDASGKLVAKITIGAVSGAFEAMKAAPLDADIGMQGGGRDYRARLNGALTANLEQKTGGIDFKGRIDESDVRGQAAVTRFAPLAITFDVEADRLDADRLMGRASPAQEPAGQASEQATPPSKPASAPPGAPATRSPAPGAPQAGSGNETDSDRIDLSALEGIDASGRIRIGTLTLLNLTSAEVQAAVKVARGRLDVAPISARLYQGRLEGSLSAQAAENPLFSVRQTLSGVDLGPLLRDAAQIDTLEGRGTVRADLSTRGATVPALKKALNGTASVQLSDGALKGIDIAGTIRSVRSKIAELQGKSVQSSNKSEKTDFTELTATFKLANGVARNDDLSMKSPLLRVEGAGDIDIGEDRLNYLLKATLVATTKGQGGRDVAELAGITVPVQLTGALDAPQWSIDFAGIAADLAKKKLKDEVLERLPGAAQQPDGKRAIEDAIKDRLKGLLGR